MVFSSTTFLFLFLPAVLILYYNPIFRSLGFRNAILIISSIFFYAWGEPFFVLLTIEKLTKFTDKIGFFGHIYMMLFVIVGWVLFRSESIPEALEYLRTMFFMSGSELFDEKALFFLDNYKFYLIAGILSSFPILPKLREKIRINSKLYNAIATVALFVTFIISLTFTIKGSYNPFIYFNF